MSLLLFVRHVIEWMADLPADFSSEYIRRMNIGRLAKHYNRCEGHDFVNQIGSPLERKRTLPKRASGTTRSECDQQAGGKARNWPPKWAITSIWVVWPAIMNCVCDLSITRMNLMVARGKRNDADTTRQQQDVREDGNCVQGFHSTPYWRSSLATPSWPDLTAHCNGV